MKVLQSILMLIAALAVLSLGAVGASASSPSAPPCHETGHSTPHETPDHAPKAMKAMICCVACVAAPTLEPAPLPGLAVSPVRISAAAVDLPAGRLLSPEPGPPRLLIA